VKHVNEELVRLYADYAARGVAFIAISSNDVEKYPDDSPEQMKLTAEQTGYQFPYSPKQLITAYNFNFPAN
jgi:glutathione peroxidase-family protein